ncbi:uncharacterized protein LOC111384650 [Olea europaea var. sylvestris]|uniref:uncharacterized protein LOC111384650 n=1 Tax=Olea europaea var. sylvestris TaxID=158386 RepID=UPI000C1CD86F|nr:uncharacterized protein LOC111384650 [Olea europaea var. sylvestris]
MGAMNENGKICFQEFRMYPPMLRHFAHVLQDEYGLTSSQQVDIYEKVGMFLCILAHGKGYRQVTTIVNHSLQIVCVFFKEVLSAIVTLSEHVIRLASNYNDGVEPHRLDLNKHPLFQDCIGAIDETHVRAVLPRHERVKFIGRKEVLTQNVLDVCDFNLCFTFMLAGYTRNTHDARILARAIYSPKLNFPQPAPGKYYLVDSGFAPRSGHSSCRNLIYRAFDVLKQRWKILDCMPSYSFRTQIAVVLATMGVHNFLRHSGVMDETFVRAEADEEIAEVDLPSAEDEVQADMNMLEMQRSDARSYLNSREGDWSYCGILKDWQPLTIRCPHMLMFIFLQPLFKEDGQNWKYIDLLMIVSQAEELVSFMSSSQVIFRSEDLKAWFASGLIFLSNLTGQFHLSTSSCGGIPLGVRLFKKSS